MSGREEKGYIYLISTPIGNLEDITLRAINLLKEIDLIAAEDTRRTGILLKHYNIKTRMESYHDHNKIKKTPFFLKKLNQGLSIGIVSDAGTPGISDPAFFLVREGIKQNIRIIPIPGATAAISALVASGLPTDRFVFEGFLPPKKGRKKRLKQLTDETRTIILYESRYRLMKTLKDLYEFLGNRTVSIGRELTKKFEEIIRGSLTNIIESLSKRNLKGEFVLVIKGADKKK